MTDYDNSNTGALFRNDKKETEKHPDYRGSAEVTCPECGRTSDHWLSSWLKTAKKDGKKFLSLAFSPKSEPKKQEPTPDFDDDLPF